MMKYIQVTSYIYKQARKTVNTSDLFLGLLVFCGGKIPWPVPKTQRLQKLLFRVEVDLFFSSAANPAKQINWDPPKTHGTNTF